MLISKYIRPFTAIAFLAIYVNVLAKNITCNWGRLTSQTGHSHSSDHDHHEHSQSHGSSKGHDHHSGSRHSESDSEKDDGNCCNDETAKISKFLTSLSNLDFNFKLSEKFVAEHPGSLNSSSIDEVTFPVLNSYSLPPPKIPDLRIYIHSFQI